MAMIDCKYCSGTGKLHDDADCYDEVGEWKARAEKAEAECLEAAKAQLRLARITSMAEAEVKRLREALEFYATMIEGDGAIWPGGNRARAALAGSATSPDKPTTSP